MRQIKETMLSVATNTEASINAASARLEQRHANALSELNKRIYKLEYAAAQPHNPVNQWFIVSFVLLAVFLVGARVAWLFIGRLVKDGQPFPSTVVTIQIGVAASVFILALAMAVVFFKIPRVERSRGDLVAAIISAVVVLYGLALLAGLGGRWPVLLAPLAYL